MNTAEKDSAADLWHHRVLNQCDEIRNQLSCLMMRLKRQDTPSRRHSTRSGMIRDAFEATWKKTIFPSNWP